MAVFLVGLTGGIGSGKSTVAAMLGDRGAVVIDADRISREVMAPGGAAYQPVVDRFGSTIVSGDGTIDRTALAGVVFGDPRALGDLEAITHPVVGQVMAERMAACAGEDRTVVLDIPLLRERGRMGVQAVVVVDCPQDVALQRLVAFRGFDRQDARRRMAAQISRDQRRALADIIVTNSGSLEELRAEVDRLWRWLEQRRIARG